MFSCSMELLIFKALHFYRFVVYISDGSDQTELMSETLVIHTEPLGSYICPFIIVS